MHLISCNTMKQDKPTVAGQANHRKGELFILTILKIIKPLRKNTHVYMYQGCCLRKITMSPKVPIHEILQEFPALKLILKKWTSCTSLSSRP